MAKKYKMTTGEKQKRHRKARETGEEKEIMGEQRKSNRKATKQYRFEIRSTFYIAERLIVVCLIVVLLISFSTPTHARSTLCNDCECRESQITCIGITDLNVLRTYRGGTIRTLFITDSNGDTLEEEDLRKFRFISALYLQHSELSNENMQAFESVTDILLLDLQSNSLTEVHMHMFAQNKKLLNLNLAKNQINYIESNAFASLKELVYLTLSDNQLEELETDVFSGLNELTSLDLSRNKLRSVSAESLAPLESLEELRMEGNALSAIDAELAQLLARPGLVTTLSANNFRCTCEALGAAFAASTATAGRSDLSVTCDGENQWGDVMPSLNCYQENTPEETTNGRNQHMMTPHTARLSHKISGDEGNVTEKNYRMSTNLKEKIDSNHQEILEKINDILRKLTGKPVKTSANIILGLQLPATNPNELQLIEKHLNLSTDAYSEFGCFSETKSFP